MSSLQSTSHGAEIRCLVQQAFDKAGVPLNACLPLSSKELRALALEVVDLLDAPHGGASSSSGQRGPEATSTKQEVNVDLELELLRRETGVSAVAPEQGVLTAAPEHARSSPAPTSQWSKHSAFGAVTSPYASAYYAMPTAGYGDAYQAAGYPQTYSSASHQHWSHWQHQWQQWNTATEQQRHAQTKARGAR